MPVLDKNPVLDELLVMKKRMETLYTESFSDGKEEAASAAEQAAWKLSADVWETEAEWGVAVDLPGVAEADLRVTIHDGRLLIAGKRRDVTEVRDCRISHRERPAGSFRRSFDLPSKSRPDGMCAELKRGVLTVIVPQTQSGSKKTHVQPG